MYIGEIYVVETSSVHTCFNSRYQYDISPAAHCVVAKAKRNFWKSESRQPFPSFHESRGHKVKEKLGRVKVQLVRMRIKIRHEKHVALSLKKRWLSRYVCLVIVLLNRVLCLMCGNGGVYKHPHSPLLLCRRRELTRSKGLSFRTTRQCGLEGARRRKSSGLREMLGWASRPLVR